MKQLIGKVCWTCLYMYYALSTTITITADTSESTVAEILGDKASPGSSSSTHKRGITVHVVCTEIQYLYSDNYFFIQGKNKRQQSLTRTFSTYLKNLRKKLMLEWKKEKER